MGEVEWKRPERLVSHVFELDRFEMLDVPEADLISEIHAKLAAENERLLRLLPDAPHGWHWEGDVEFSEEIGSNFSGEIKARVVYRCVRDSRGNSWR